MEATLVIELLRDAYSLVEFVQQTAHTIRNHESERGDIDLKFATQNLRLKRFSDFFTTENGDAADIARLQVVPEENLRLVRAYLVKLQKILVEYKDAAYKDKEYRQNAYLYDTAGQPQPQPEGKLPGPQAESQHVLGANSEQKASSGSARSDPVTDRPKASKWKIWELFGRQRKDNKPKDTPGSSSGIKTVAKGVGWLFEKDKLESLLDEFTKWNNELEGTIPYVLSGIAVDRPLRNMLGQADDGNNTFGVHIEMQQASQKPIAWENVEAVIRLPRVLTEYKVGPSDKMVYAQQLAWLLRAAGNHKFNTLPFRGFALDSSNPPNSQWAFLFDYPEGSTDAKPISLHDVILSDKTTFRMSLKHRFHVAHAVAAAIGAFHADGWFHKSIRSSAIKFFFKPDGSCDFGNPCLTEFESSRPEGGQSLVTKGDTSTVKDPERDVYLHPDRYDPPKPFTRVYDVFSLGVVLLEIGLWQTARQIYDEVAPQIQRRDGTGVSAKAMQSAFLQHTKTRLEHRMGTSYREAVEDCLRGNMERYLGTPGFAIEYRNRIVAKVDIEKLVGDD
ncbi:hypothetical protein C8A00DRAFT_46865 [Chaetomidium leptoderma]|uniref:Protein kinase domain-containing protein n=1 Tax=Chaetomidium leptoderma TaxID=669021 RepID=A0AAN6VDS9_9PEZI|nr:hypothetical protein C8A00DRAFT_46865 [Chaetomidium leptoderma]